MSRLFYTIFIMVFTAFLRLASKDLKTSWTWWIQVMVTWLQHVKDYIKEAVRQLNKTQYYRQFSHNPTATNKKLIDPTKERLTKERSLKEKVADELKLEIQNHLNSTLHQKYKED